MYKELYDSFKELFSQPSLVDELRVDSYDDEFKKKIAIACMKAGTSITKISRIIESSENEKLKYLFIQAKDYNYTTVNYIQYKNEQYFTVIMSDNLCTDNQEQNVYEMMVITSHAMSYICKLFNINVIELAKRNQERLSTFDESLLYSQLILVTAMSEDIFNKKCNDILLENEEVKKIFNVIDGKYFNPTKDTIVSAIKILRECNNDVGLLLDHGLLSTASNDIYKDLFYYSIERRVV